MRRNADERAAERVQPLAEEVEALSRQRDSAGSNLTDLRRQLGLVSGEEEPILVGASVGAGSVSGSSFDLPSAGSGFESPAALGVFESESAPLLINKQRDGADIDRTQQLPVVR